MTGYADSDGNGNDDSLATLCLQIPRLCRPGVERRQAARPVRDRATRRRRTRPAPWNDLTPEKAELLAATGFLAHGSRRNFDRRRGRALAANQVVADTLKIVGSSLLGVTVGCAQCHDHRYDPIPQADYYRLRAVFEPALDTSHWRRPVQRLVSLFKDADRAKCQGHRGRGRSKLQKVVDDKTKTYLAAATREGAGEVSRAASDQAPRCLMTAAAEATDEQKRLLASNPSVNITAGVLYQYDPAAAEDLKKEKREVAAKRAEKPVEDFVSVLDEVPGVCPDETLPSRRPPPADASVGRAT